RRSYTPATRCSTPLGRRSRLRAGESISSISSEVTVTCGRLISTASRLVFLWTIPVFPFPISVRYLVVPYGCRDRMAARAGPAHAPVLVPPVPGETLTAWWIPRLRRPARPPPRGGGR